MRAARKTSILCAVILTVGVAFAAACVINPQPLPPGEEKSANPEPPPSDNGDFNSPTAAGAGGDGGCEGGGDIDAAPNCDAGDGGEPGDAAEAG